MPLLQAMQNYVQERDEVKETDIILLIVNMGSWWGRVIVIVGLLIIHEQSSKG